MKKLFLLLFMMIFISAGTVMAQRRNPDGYTTSLGFKFYPGSITFKQNLFNGNKLEAIAYFWRGTRFTGLYELCYDIEGIRGLQWFAGPGAHLMTYNEGEYSGRSYIGFDGVLGLDYKVKNTPLNLSLDWQPSIDFGAGGFNGGFGGLGVRYVLH